MPTKDPTCPSGAQSAARTVEIVRLLTDGVAALVDEWDDLDPEAVLHVNDAFTVVTKVRDRVCELAIDGPGECDSQFLKLGVGFELDRLSGVLDAARSWAGSPA